MRRRALVAAAAAVVALLPAAPAAGAVTTPSGASADTTLVCQRLYGSWALGTQSRGFHWLRLYTYLTATQSGGWTDWYTPDTLNNASWGLPSRGQLAVYVQYAYWNGVAWEMAGEWGKVYNARGEHVSWYC